jgi:hypothetical protein
MYRKISLSLYPTDNNSLKTMIIFLVKSTEKIGQAQKWLNEKSNRTLREKESKRITTI